jgi:hypothetical protein
MQEDHPATSPVTRVSTLSSIDHTGALAVYIDSELYAQLQQGGASRVLCAHGASPGSIALQTAPRRGQLVSNFVALDSIVPEGKARSEHEDHSLLQCDSRVQSALSDLIRIGQCAIEALVSMGQEGVAVELMICRSADANGPGAACMTPPQLPAGVQDMGTCKLLFSYESVFLVGPAPSAPACAPHQDIRVMGAGNPIGNQFESSDPAAGHRTLDPGERVGTSKREEPGDLDRAASTIQRLLSVCQKRAKAASCIQRCWRSSQVCAISQRRRLRFQKALVLVQKFARHILAKSAVVRLRRRRMARLVEDISSYMRQEGGAMRPLSHRDATELCLQFAVPEVWTRSAAVFDFPQAPPGCTVAVPLRATRLLRGSTQATMDPVNPATDKMSVLFQGIRSRDSLSPLYEPWGRREVCMAAVTSKVE